MNLSNPHNRLVASYRVVEQGQPCKDSADTVCVDHVVFCGLFAEERREQIFQYLHRACEGDDVVTVEQLQDGSTRLLLVEAQTEGEAGVLARIVELQDISVPEHLTSRVLGMRAATIHQICNDLSAARLNSELAERILQSSDATIDLRVADALKSVIRLSKTVEAQLRELQQTVKLNLQGNIDE